MANQSGIAITIKAFLPTGKTLDEQFEALSIVREAHAGGDYSALLKAAKVEEVKTEQKVRRIEDTPAPTTETTGNTATGQGDESGLKEAFNNVPPEGDIDDTAEAQEKAEGEGVPAFLKNSKSKAA